jgi:hypothetical protein
VRVEVPTDRLEEAHRLLAEREASPILADDEEESPR